MDQDKYYLTKTHRMEKKKKVDLDGFFVTLLVIVFVLHFIYSHISEKQIIDLLVQKQDVIEQRDALQSKSDSLQAELDKLHDLSWENVVYWVDTLGIDHPEIVMQQIALETGMLTSAICLENSNLFGMKEPRVRETTALGTQRGHAHYHNYIDSIKDYKLWQDNMYDGGDYYAFLNRVGYAEANHYIAALKTI